jgi:hypothetical protein
MVAPVLTVAVLLLLILFRHHILIFFSFLFVRRDHLHIGEVVEKRLFVNKQSRRIYSLVVGSLIILVVNATAIAHFVEVNLSLKIN